MSTPYVRLRPSALILRAGQVLLVEYDDENGLHYNFPGGGLESGESLHQALRREIREETCAEIEIHRLLCVSEYYPPALAYQYGPTHALLFLFLCSLQPDSEPRLPDAPDPNQTGVRWFDLYQLDAIPLLPGRMQNMVIQALNTGFDPFTQDQFRNPR
jgi:8-oxo-dGTP diphosphatase